MPVDAKPRTPIFASVQNSVDNLDSAKIELENESCECRVVSCWFTSFVQGFKYWEHNHTKLRMPLRSLTIIADKSALNRAENILKTEPSDACAVSSNVRFFTSGGSSYDIGKRFYTTPRGEADLAGSTLNGMNAYTLDSSQIEMSGTSQIILPTVVLGNLFRVLLPEILGLAVASIFSIGLLVYALPRYGASSWALGFTVAGNLLALIFALLLGSRRTLTR
jgi:hypothetical protein